MANIRLDLSLLPSNIALAFAHGRTYPLGLSKSVLDLDFRPAPISLGAEVVSSGGVSFRSPPARSSLIPGKKHYIFFLFECEKGKRGGSEYGAWDRQTIRKDRCDAAHEPRRAATRAKRNNQSLLLRPECFRRPDDNERGMSSPKSTDTVRDANIKKKKHKKWPSKVTPRRPKNASIAKHESWAKRHALSNELPIQTKKKIISKIHNKIEPKAEPKRMKRTQRSCVDRVRGMTHAAETPLKEKNKKKKQQPRQQHYQTVDRSTFVVSFCALQRSSF